MNHIVIQNFTTTNLSCLKILYLYELTDRLHLVSTILGRLLFYQDNHHHESCMEVMP